MPFKEVKQKNKDHVFTTFINPNDVKKLLGLNTANANNMGNILEKLLNKGFENDNHSTENLALLRRTRLDVFAYLHAEKEISGTIDAFTWGADAGSDSGGDSEGNPDATRTPDPAGPPATQGTGHGGRLTWDEKIAYLVKLGADDLSDESRASMATLRELVKAQKEEFADPNATGVAKIRANARVAMEALNAELLLEIQKTKGYTNDDDEVDDDKFESARESPVEPEPDEALAIAVTPAAAGGGIISRVTSAVTSAATTVIQTVTGTTPKLEAKKDTPIPPLDQQSEDTKPIVAAPKGATSDAAEYIRQAVAADTRERELKSEMVKNKTHQKTGVNKHIPIKAPPIDIEDILKKIRPGSVTYHPSGLLEAPTLSLFIQSDPFH